MTETKKAATAAPITQADSSKTAGNLNENRAGFKKDLSATLTNGLLIICAKEKINLDLAGVFLLQTFFSKFVAMWTAKKKITPEKLHEVFCKVFHKNKHFTKTKEGVLLAGDFACALCATTSMIENLVTQENFDAGKEL